MNKVELASAVAAAIGCTKADAAKAVSAVFEAIEKDLVAGQSTQLVGFGTFKVNQKKARTARNPRTGEVVEIPAKKAVAFVPGKALKEAVNG